MQQETTNAAKGNTGSKNAAGEPRAALLDVNHVAAMLQCSVRTVYRLSDSGRMPKPVKLGALVRWSGEALEQWIAEGCPCSGRRVSRR